LRKVSSREELGSQVLDAMHYLNRLDINHTYKLARERSKEQNEDGNRNLCSVWGGVFMRFLLNFPNSYNYTFEFGSLSSLSSSLWSLRSVLVQSPVKSLLSIWYQQPVCWCPDTWKWASLGQIHSLASLAKQLT